MTNAGDEAFFARLEERWRTFKTDYIDQAMDPEIRRQLMQEMMDESRLENYLIGTPEAYQAMRSNTRRALAGIGGASVALGLMSTWWVGAAAAPILAAGALTKYSQDMMRDYPRRFFSWARDRGDARMLTGYVPYQILIVEMDGQKLSGQWRNHAEYELTCALRYLSRQAARREKKLRFDRARARVHTIECDALETDEFGHVTRESSDRLKGAVLASGAWSALDRQKNGFLLVLTTGSHHPFAVQTSPWPNSSLQEFAVSPAWADRICFAHEILHLYGARDLYRWKGKHAERRNSIIAQATEHTGVQCRNSVMGDHDDDAALEDLHVDEGTAYAIGWTDTAPTRREPND